MVEETAEEARGAERAAVARAVARAAAVGVVFIFATIAFLGANCDTAAGRSAAGCVGRSAVQPAAQPAVRHGYPGNAQCCRRFGIAAAGPSCRVQMLRPLFLTCFGFRRLDDSE